MTERFICSQTGRPCPKAVLCEGANEPLVGAVTFITSRAAGPRRQPEYAAAALLKELSHQGDTLGANFKPQVDYPDVNFCPGDILNRPAPQGVSMEQVIDGLAVIVRQCIAAAIASGRNY